MKTSLVFNTVKEPNYVYTNYINIDEWSKNSECNEYLECNGEFTEWMASDEKKLNEMWSATEHKFNDGSQRAARRSTINFKFALRLRKQK